MVILYPYLQANHLATFGIMMRNLSLQINRKETLTQLMALVLERARAYGASDASVSVNHHTGFSVDVRMGDVETIAFSEEKGVAVTVYYGQQKGSATSSDVSPGALDTTVKAACEIAEVSAKDPYFGLPDDRDIVHNYPEIDLYDAWQMQPEQASKLALDCEAVALQLDKRICNSDGVQVSTYSSGYGYANTRGFMGVVEGTRHGLSCSLIAQDALGGMQRDYAYTAARRPADLMSYQDLAALAAERTIKRLSPRTLKTQKTPVIISSRVSSGLLGSFIQAVSGSSLYRKQSFLLDSIGQRVFPEYINIYEDPHKPFGLGSAAFDSEGVVTRPNMIVQNGILQQYVLGVYTARKLGLKTTANGGGVHNLTLQATAGNLTELIRTMHRGLLVTELMGQGVNEITGDYSRGAAGFWVEGGVIQYPVDNITIAGNLKNMFLQMIAVGNDYNPSIATQCGSILIEEMTIAGH